MFALVAAIFFILRAFDIKSDDVDFAFLALGFWALHFVWNPIRSISLRRD